MVCQPVVFRPCCKSTVFPVVVSAILLLYPACFHRNSLIVLIRGDFRCWFVRRGIRILLFFIRVLRGITVRIGIWRLFFIFYDILFCTGFGDILGGFLFAGLGVYDILFLGCINILLAHHQRSTQYRSAHRCLDQFLIPHILPLTQMYFHPI